MKKFDHILIGISIGLLSIGLMLVVFFFIKFTDTPFSTYISTIFSERGVLSPLISLSGLPNLLFFFLFLNKEKYNTAKGIIIATLVLVLMVLILKII